MKDWQTQQIEFALKETEFIEHLDPVCIINIFSVSEK